MGKSCWRALDFVVIFLWLIRTAKFEVCSIENIIWWQFKSQKYEEDLYGKKLLEGKACPNLAVLHIFSCSFHFSIHKVPSINLVGRSRDLLSQKAYCLQLKFFRNLWRVCVVARLLLCDYLSWCWSVCFFEFVLPDEMSVGRKEAFEIFRRDYSHNDTIEENKVALKQRWVSHTMTLQKLSHTTILQK